MKKIFTSIALIALLFQFGLFIPSVSAAEAEVQEETEVSLALTDEDINEITDEELTEAEPSELPRREHSATLAQQMEGLMLLDVEGNGEVYYVDPVTGAKEYLADGAAAHSLLERRALGINEENFALLVQGVEKGEESVCRTNELGTRLKGRIVLRVEKQGEAWWILPVNCRAYYVGTQEAAYNLMKRFSLGITKDNLARIPDTDRQKLKRAVRFSVYAYAEENGVDLQEARDAVKAELGDVRACLRAKNVSSSDDIERGFVRSHLRVCWDESQLPVINKERLVEIRADISSARQERMETRKELRQIRVDSNTELDVR